MTERSSSYKHPEDESPRGQDVKGQDAQTQDAQTQDAGGYEDIGDKHADVLLLGLTELIERLDNGDGVPSSVSLTATTPGAVVSGLLVPRRWWVEETVRHLTADAATFGTVMGSLFDEFRPDGTLPRYFHLMDARLIVGPGDQSDIGMLWRGRIADVSGWSLTQIR